MPNPIREAFRLNSDPRDVVDGTFSGWSEGGVGVDPPIFFRVVDSDRNSDVRSR